MTRQEELRLLALAIELEGTIGVYRQKMSGSVGGYSYMPVISLSQISERVKLVEYVAELAQCGFIGNRKNAARHANERPMCAWQTTAGDAVVLARELLPFMLTKKKQTALVARFPTGERGIRLSDSVREKRRKLYVLTLELNRVGVKKKGPEARASGPLT